MMISKLLPAIFALLAFFCGQSLFGATRPNVLFIATDDFRNDIGCYGHSLVKTPHLDALAKRAMVFERAYCQQALCNPSRASLMTGRRPDTLRIWNLTKHYRSESGIVTLPQYFKSNGWFTQGIGKLFHNWKDEKQSDPESWSVPEQMHIGTHYDDKPVIDGPLPENFAKHPKAECRDVPDEAYYDGRITKMAIESLRDRADKTEPFFLGVGFWKPHSPFNAPKKYWNLYRREDVPPPSPAEWPKDAPRIAWHNSREILGDKGTPLAPAIVQELRHGYLANISYLDAQIGRVLDELDRLKLTENTIIIFWSDHGYHMGEQTLWAKTSNFELDARVPLMIATPEMKSGQRTKALAELLDLYPTLAELCSLPRPEGIEGTSLVPVLRDPSKAVRTAAMTQHPRPAYYKGEPEVMGYSVRTETFRHTEWRDWKSGATIARELYDHRTDPNETHNLADDPAHAEDVKRGAAELLKFQPQKSAENAKK
jgi:iduronate 2-sulfatase